MKSGSSRSLTLDARKCRKCEVTKPLSEFWFHHEDVHRGSCKTCYLANRAKWRREGGDSNRNRRNKVEYCDHPECSQIKRSVVLERGDYACGICHDPIEDEWHMDHIIPVSKRGKHCYYNLQPSHPVCNLMKGDTILAE